MKLILTQEVTGLGQPGDVVEVKDGYGRNYLLPRGVAIRWTRGAEKTVESIKNARTSRAVRDHDHADQLKAKLEAAPVHVKVQAGEAGRLFGAVTITDIADAIAASSARRSTSGPSRSATRSRSLGAHEVTVRLHDEVSPRWPSTSSRLTRPPRRRPAPDRRRRRAVARPGVAGSGESGPVVGVRATQLTAARHYQVHYPGG